MVFLNTGLSGHVKEDSKSRRSTWKPSAHIISSVCHLVRVFIVLFIHQQVNDTVCQWHPFLSIPQGITTAASSHWEQLRDFPGAKIHLQLVVWLLWDLLAPCY